MINVGKLRPLKKRSLGGRRNLGVVVTVSKKSRCVKFSEDALELFGIKPGFTNFTVYFDEHDGNRLMVFKECSVEDEGAFTVSTANQIISVDIIHELEGLGWLEPNGYTARYHLHRDPASGMIAVDFKDINSFIRNGKKTHAGTRC